MDNNIKKNNKSNKNNKSKNNMKIAILSGKGGTGKTFVSVNLASVAKKSTYLDCDVEEPNGHLFFKPTDIKKENVSVLLPESDTDKCNGCRKCVDFCRFNALAFVGNKLKVFKEVCHSCGGCKIICPENAINEVPKIVGHVETGTHENVTAITGMLNLGEASGVPVIKNVLSKADNNNLTIIDCPPGSACTTMESIESADYCILVAEPTAFGVHNFKMVHELVTLLGIPLGVIINKYENEDNQMEQLCKEQQLNVLARIPYSDKLAKITSNGLIATGEDKDTKNMFEEILHKVELEVTR